MESVFYQSGGGKGRRSLPCPVEGSKGRMGKDFPKTALQSAQRLRRYIHFDVPLSKSDCAQLVSDPQRVKRHSFYPFLRHDVIRPKLKRMAGGQITKSWKIRDIRYAAHSDAAIYSYYNFILMEHYEALIAELKLNENVIAFRALSKSNVDFATDAFRWIGAHRPCVALGFDVKDFFGGLSHSVLKSAWCRVLGAQALPDDHFAVFQSLTKHASVELIAARKALGLSRASLERIDRLCSPAQFRSVIRAGGMIEVNSGGCGIPQGSPISAALSNIYMLQFDVAVKSEVEACGGLYRRYCDDILVVVPESPGVEDHFSAFVENQLHLLRLQMQPSKTLVCHYDAGANDKPLQYLGLILDGSRVLLRPSGVARFYQKMRKGVAQLKNSKRLDGATALLFQRRRSLINRYTEHTPGPGRSYFKYVKRAAKKTNSRAINRQLRLHRARFKSLVEQ